MRKFVVKMMGKINGIRVLYSPDAVKSCGYRGGMATRMKLTGEWFSKPTIVIDDWTVKQKPFVKDFILNHEAGHIKHHDGLKSLMRFGLNFNKMYMARVNHDPIILKQEFGADEFAATAIGNKYTIKALKKLRSGLPFRDRFGSSGKEIKLRIKNIKSL